MILLSGLTQWVMARQKSLSTCMLQWVTARLCARDWLLVRFSVIGHGLVRFSFVDHGLVRFSLWAGIGEGLILRAWTGGVPSLSRPGLGRDYLSWRRDSLSLGWDNLTMCQICSHRTRNISPCALCLQAWSRSLHETRGIVFNKHSSPISLQVACIDLVRCHRNMQLGKIGFTYPCVDGF